MTGASPPGSAPLRIGLVCPYSLSRPGGVQGQVLGLARVLGSRGHRAVVFAPVDGRCDPGDVDVVAVGHSVAVPSNGSRAPVSLSPAAIARGVGRVRSARLDVVHVHEPFAPGLSYGLMAAHATPPLVATFHRSGASRFYSLLGPLSRRLARRFGALTAVSEAARETARSAVGEGLEVLFNGVEVERHRDAEPWPTEGPTVLFLGRHEERKGLGVLLGAWESVAGSGGSGDGRPTLWIAGDGPETDRLRRQYPPSATVRWLGMLSEEEKLRRLAGADVLCAPSLGGESFGMVLLEAMAARTLVVASDIDGYRDAVGADAVLFPPGDRAALARSLTAILAADRPSGGRSAVLEAGSRRAAAWSMERLADRYETIYRSVVGGPTP